jgi:hypothetical protein
MIFMLVLLKIPIVYLCVVVWWAIKGEQRPEQPSALVPVADPDRGPVWRRGGRGAGGRGGPTRRPGPRRAVARRADLPR